MFNLNSTRPDRRFVNVPTIVTAIRLNLSACTLAAFGLCAQAQTPPQSAAETVVVTAKRGNRVSAGATGLPLDLKDTPQSISVLDRHDLANFGVSGSNDALRLATGLDVDAYETNRTIYTARGFEVQMTQIDGLGVSNSWGTVVGQLDTFLFDRIELIRGANGLLTGVGNASGTINHVRKRPLNSNAGELLVTAGSYAQRRAAADLNRVLAADGSWAARLVASAEDKDSHLRALHDRNTTVYAVVDGQVGRDGMLTLGFTHRDARQDSPMWGSLTLNHVDGSPARFARSASTSQDWTYWNTRTSAGFVEYSHGLGADWELKFTLEQSRNDERTRLLYAYTNDGGLQPDNTGLLGWPYRGDTLTDRTLVELKLTGRFQAMGRRHDLIVGLTHSRQDFATDTWATADFRPLPAFPYAGNVYAEPSWAPRAPASAGEQRLTRFVAATRLRLGDRLAGIAGLNAVRLQRSGSSVYGAVVNAENYPDTREISPYAGITYDFTPALTGYASYSDIFQNQDQYDIQRRYLDPVRGVNAEAGLKAEWLGGQLLTTAALFTAQQKGLATFAGIDAGGQYFYEPKDVKSRGVELEAMGQLDTRTKLALGFTRLKLTGPDGADIYEWVPRSTLRLRADRQLESLPQLRLGASVQWQSDVRKAGGARQAAYAVVDAFAAWSFSPRSTLRLNLRNLLDKTYVDGLAYGAIYGAPRNASLTLSHTI